MSNKNSILLVDPEFDPNTAADCNLLLKITSDSISYAIIDKNSKQLKVVYDHQECKDIAHHMAIGLKNDPYLKLPFKEIKVSVYTINSVAVPHTLYDSENLDVYANFFTEAQSSNLYVQPFAKFGFNSVFSFHQLIEDTLTVYLKDCKRYDHAAPALTIAGSLSGNALVLDFTTGSFNALYVREQQLIFQNYFEIENGEEFNYYLLLMIQELQIDKTDAHVVLSGIVHDNDPYFTILSKYFQHIQLNTPMNNDIDHTLLEDMPSHYYTSLLALDLCE